ncbi:Hypothetical protein R9X50_00519300 [Acrodontium crateriforme]|uniref:Uncharacterized protein n=1 Tax=Acrodontium crateriforme TaxID=150365 RepID=A0AAQ3M7H8_9PEZI|nr:Hypothetical protein R9X50_00519300 [Acrodontium crateriforme]
MHQYWNSLNLPLSARIELLEQRMQAVRSLVAQLGTETAISQRVLYMNLPGHLPLLWSPVMPSPSPETTIRHEHQDAIVAIRLDAASFRRGARERALRNASTEYAHTEETMVPQTHQTTEVPSAPIMGRRTTPSANEPSVTECMRQHYRTDDPEEIPTSPPTEELSGSTLRPDLNADEEATQILSEQLTRAFYPPDLGERNLELTRDSPLPNPISYTQDELRRLMPSLRTSARRARMQSRIIPSAGEGGQPRLLVRLPVVSPQSEALQGIAMDAATSDHVRAQQNDQRRLEAERRRLAAPLAAETIPMYMLDPNFRRDCQAFGSNFRNRLAHERQGESGYRINRLCADNGRLVAYNLHYPGYPDGPIGSSLALFEWHFPRNVLTHEPRTAFDVEVEALRALIGVENTDWMVLAEIELAFHGGLISNEVAEAMWALWIEDGDMRIEVEGYSDSESE